MPDIGQITFGPPAKGFDLEEMWTRGWKPSVIDLTLPPIEVWGWHSLPLPPKISCYLETAIKIVALCPELQGKEATIAEIIEDDYSGYVDRDA
jgi:hypothetical protein